MIYHIEQECMHGARECSYKITCLEVYEAMHNVALKDEIRYEQGRLQSYQDILQSTTEQHMKGVQNDC